MNDLVKRDMNLPATIEDLSKFVLVGREKLTSVRAEIRAIDKLGLAAEVMTQKKDEAQMLAGALLDAEARIGKLTKAIPKATENQYTVQKDTAVPKQKAKAKTLKDLGFTEKQKQRFEILADNEDIIEQVKAEAIENDDLPTQTEVLRRVKEKAREQARTDIKDSCKTINMPTGLYDVILCDPPWQYEFCSSENRKIENHYPTMTLEDICNLKIPTDDNCILFLWATAPKLKEAMQVIDSWGFNYRTCAVWDKEIIGMGYWFRNQHELLLVCVKGKVSAPDTSNRVSSVIRERRGKHSKKPEVVYNVIQNMFPNGKYLEMFAREQHNDKWSVWGNQVE